MKYFTKDYVAFFNDLQANNYKQWFHSQKKRYEESVRNPFINFVDALIAEVKKHQSDINVTAKECISRINRDIRFSKDKTPYNLHLNAFISPGGKKDKSLPGLAIRLSNEMVGIMGGCYALDKSQLSSLRNHMIQNPGELQDLLNEKSFQSKFGEIRGDKIKRIPKEFKEHIDTIPLLANKQFYVMAEEKINLIHSEKLMEVVLEYYKTMRPVNMYLANAISNTDAV